MSGRSRTRPTLAYSLWLALFASTSPAQAPPQVGAPPAPAPPPYSLPWLLRPAAAATVVRLDQTLASYDLGTESRGTWVTTLIASYKLSPRWAPVARLAFVKDETSARGGTAFANPLVGVNYVRPLSGGWRATAFLSSTLPLGQGGGDQPDPGSAFAVGRGIPARSAMENALFAVNYWTVIGGGGVARVTPELTFQAEATGLQLTRVRGPKTQDDSRTNLTVGVHLGHFFSRRFSLGGELRFQRWMSDAAPVKVDPRARETLTFGLGPRFHLKLSGKRWLRPGLSYSRALDDPMEAASYGIWQLDVPVSF